jgi:hypothetical protein
VNETILAKDKDLEKDTHENHGMQSVQTKEQKARLNSNEEGNPIVQGTNPGE